MSLVELFCAVDDFCQGYEAEQAPRLTSDAGRKYRQPGLKASEIMTIIIHFHQSGYRDFKHYYVHQVQAHLKGEFPGLVSYNRFVRLMPRVLVLLWAYLVSRCGRCRGIAFIDSTSLKVCHNRRIGRHKVFAGLAARGQSSMGWFYGFKLHLVVNDVGEIVAFMLTPGNVHDTKPVPHLARRLFGKLFGDKGYLSATLFQSLFQQGLQLITTLRRKMKNALLPLEDKLFLRKRYIIETINDQLKNVSQIEHSRHRSPHNFLVNLFAGLIAYTWQPHKPAINWSAAQSQALTLFS